MIDPLEERLSRMRPAELPPELMRKCRGLRPERAHRSSWGWAAGLAAAAAAIALGFSLWPADPLTPPIASAPPVAPSPPHVFTPVESRNHLIETQDLGIVFAQTDHPVRLVRCLWLDDDTYRGTDGVSSLRMTRGREQIVPVPLEVF